MMGPSLGPYGPKLGPPKLGPIMAPGPKGALDSKGPLGPAKGHKPEGHQMAQKGPSSPKGLLGGVVGVGDRLLFGVLR